MEGWIVKKEKGKQTVLQTPNKHSGIQITVNKKRKSLHFFAWYDSFVGIEGADLTLEDIVQLFKE